MAEHSRYNVSQDQAGLNGGILKNKFGITDQERLDNIETILFNDTYSHFLELLENGKIDFNLKLLFKIHKHFLGTVYSWAGKIREVDISKDNVLFAPSQHISTLLEEFEKDFSKNIPLESENKASVVKKLSWIHIELNTIHPFREGNGRTIRLFLDLLAIHAGWNIVDYEAFSKKEYINACIAGMNKDYTKMEKLFMKGLQGKE